MLCELRAQRPISCQLLHSHPAHARREASVGRQAPLRKLSSYISCLIGCFTLRQNAWRVTWRVERGASLDYLAFLEARDNGRLNRICDMTDGLNQIGLERTDNSLLDRSPP